MSIKDVFIHFTRLIPLLRLCFSTLVIGGGLLPSSLPFSPASSHTLLPAPTHTLLTQIAGNES